MCSNLLCGYITIYCCALKRKHTIELKYQTLPLMGATRPEAAEKCPTRDDAAEKTDAGRVAPIRVQCPGTTVLPLASNPLFNLSI